jgi:hypothetical protein
MSVLSEAVLVPVLDCAGAPKHRSTGRAIDYDSEHEHDVDKATRAAY